MSKTGLFERFCSQHGVDHAMYLPPNAFQQFSRAVDSAAAAKAISRKDPTDYAWVTFSKRHQDDKQTDYDDAERMFCATYNWIISCKCFAWAIWCYEQSEINENLRFSHFHFHLLYGLSHEKKSYSHSKVKFDLKKLLGPFGLVTNNHVYNFVQNLPEDEIPIKYNYMLGDKHGHKQEDKLAKCRIDVLMRKHFELDEIYRVGSAPDSLLGVEPSSPDEIDSEEEFEDGEDGDEEEEYNLDDGDFS